MWQPCLRQADAGQLPKSKILIESNENMFNYNTLFNLSQIGDYQKQNDTL